jgi:hypothetical protein
MTCRYEKTDWRDVLYTSVRNTTGGVADAANFLKHRRGRSMHPETLRAKLRGLEDESLHIDICYLLTEWMEERGQPDASAWIQAFASEFGLVCFKSEVEASSGRASLASILEGGLDVSASTGVLSGLLSAALKDRCITTIESDRIAAEIDNEMRQLAALRSRIMSASSSGFAKA